MQQTRPAPPASLDAVLERITYANQDTGYTVARVATDRSGDLLTVIGPLLGLSPGRACGCRAGGRAIPSTAASSRSRRTRRSCPPPFRGSAATSARG